MGLFNRFFSKNSRSEETSEETTEPTESGNGYFLPPDEAKTFGNIEFMRTAKRLKRTFPATGGAKEGAEVVEQISSLQKLNGNSNGSLPSEPEVIQPDPALEPEIQERRRSDTSLDLFRSMAKDLRRQP